ncbi:MAG: pilus assembly protein PilM, partial [Planctomycetota bacterium]
KKLDEMIGYEAQQQIPFPIDEVIWDYHICKDDTMGAEKEVGIFAVRKEVISDFMIDYESSGLHLELISVGYLGLLNYALFDLRPKKPSVIVDIGSDHTDLLVVDGRRFWVRNLAIAGNDVTQALQEKFKLQFSEAEKLKRHASKSEQAVKIFSVVQPVLKELVNEIHRSVGFYKSQAGDVKFEEVYLFGNGARLLGIQKYLQEHLRFKVHVEKGFHRIRVNREANVALLQQEFPSFASVVGNGVQALGEGEVNVNLLPQEQKAALEFKKKQRVVLVAAASLYLLVAFLWLNYNKKIESAELALQNTEIVKTLDKHDREIKRLYGEERDELQTHQTQLIGYGENRLQPLIGLDAVREVFSSFNGKENITRDVPEDQQASVLGEMEGEMDDLNGQKIWLCSYRLSRVILNSKNEEIDFSKRRKGGDEDKVMTPAYKIFVCGKTYSKESQRANIAMIQERLTGPLQRLLEADTGLVGVGNPHKIELLSPDDKIPNQLYHAARDLRDRFPLDKDKDQGASFFHFEMHWYQHIKKPEEPDEPDENDDGNSGNGGGK